MTHTEICAAIKNNEFTRFQLEDILYTAFGQIPALETVKLSKRKKYTISPQVVVMNGLLALMEKKHLRHVLSINAHSMLYNKE